MECMSIIYKSRFGLRLYYYQDIPKNKSFWYLESMIHKNRKILREYES